MKKAFMMFFVLMLLSLPAGVGAVEPDTGAAALAQYFSEDVEFFYGMRTDDAYLDELDGLLADAIAKLPASIAAEIPPTTLRGELVKALNDASDNANFDLSLEALREWVGDYMAFTTTDINASTPPASLALSITDRAAAEAFWDSVLEVAPLMENYEKVAEGDFTLYQSTDDSDDGPLVAINDDVLLILDEQASGADILPAAPLSESEAFQTAVSNLPAQAYNILGYVSADAFDMADTGLVTTTSVLNPGNVAFGLTILDDVTLTIDVVLSNPENTTPALPPVDPTFARFIPANAAAVAHSTDLSALYTLLVQQLKLTGASTDGPEQIKSGLAMLGIDLQEDILGWTTGDYAVYMSIDPDAFITITGVGGAFGAPPAFETFPLNAGLLIEATDPEAAATLATKLTNTLKQFASNQPEITFSDVTVAGTSATVISTEVPMGAGDSLTLELLLGASDEVFFFGTAPDLMATLAGEPGLDQSALYQATSAYFVPQPSSILYTDDTGLLTVTVVPLALIGPAVGNVFNNIIFELEAGNSSSVSPQAQFVAYQSDPTPAEFLQAWSDIISSSSITSTYAIEGITLTRAVITLED